MEIKEIQNKISEAYDLSARDIGQSVFYRDFDHIPYDYDSVARKSNYEQGITFQKNEGGYVRYGDNIMNLEKLGLKFEIVDGYGGEGEGDDYWGVCKLSDSNGNELCFKLSGWYASHVGAECDSPEDWTLVKEVEVITKEYQPV